MVNGLHKSCDLVTRPGLVNLGNTCFISSVLQGIASSSIVLDQLSNDFKRLNGRLNSSIHASAVDVLMRLHSDSVSFAPTAFVRQLKEKYASFGMSQQDAEELFLIVAGILFDDSINTDDYFGLVGFADSLSTLKPHRSISIPVSIMDSDCLRYGPVCAGQESEMCQEDFGIFPCSQLHCSPEHFRSYGKPHPFRGLLSSTFLCSVCGGHQEMKIDSFFDLSLTIPHMGFENVAFLEDCLRNWSEAETVVGALCDRCLLTNALDVLRTRQHQLQTAASLIPQHSRKDLEQSISRDLEYIASCTTAASFLPEHVRSRCRQVLEGRPAGSLVKRLSIARPPQVKRRSNRSPASASR